MCFFARHLPLGPGFLSLKSSFFVLWVNFNSLLRLTFLFSAAHYIDLESNNWQQSNTKRNHEIDSKFCVQMRKAKTKEDVGN